MDKNGRRYAAHISTGRIHPYIPGKHKPTPCFCLCTFQDGGEPGHPARVRDQDPHWGCVWGRDCRERLHCADPLGHQGDGRVLFGRQGLGQEGCQCALSGVFGCAIDHLCPPSSFLRLLFCGSTLPLPHSLLALLCRPLCPLI